MTASILLARVCADGGADGTGGTSATGGTGGTGGMGGDARACEPGGGSDLCTNNNDCSDDDCVCCDCDTDLFCSDPENCVNDGECTTFREGCVCADCIDHPECLN
ncbi:MAG: hypothetical protein OEM15_00500 [Myxococcales bacterium]|nr:hypothetical protein [Myxococcales bacterium]MDH3486315.1 hypothetical protein [Myxococcales bacterium]